jgi:two-component system, cell cycle sensor histidine kinase and response regulator CckA
VNDEATPEPSIAPASASPPSLILIIDDEQDVCELLMRMLTRIGKKVLVATDPRQGLELFRVHASTVACVLLDLSMPQMAGGLVLTELRRIESGVQVIVMSGYSADIAQDSIGDQRPAGFLSKPFTFADLKAAIHSVC